MIVYRFNKKLNGSVHMLQIGEAIPYTQGLHELQNDSFNRQKYRRKEILRPLRNA